AGSPLNKRYQADDAPRQAGTFSLGRCAPSGVDRLRGDRGADEHSEAGGRVPADEEGEVEGRRLGDLIITAHSQLELAVGGRGGPSLCAVQIDSQGKDRRENLNDGDSAREDVSRRANSDRAGQRIARNLISKIHVDDRGFGKGLLDDRVEVDVGKARSELV